MQQLICEGVCNDGRVVAYDAAVKSYGRMETGAYRHNGHPLTMSAAPESILALVRKFVYTPHEREYGSLCRCQRCGCARVG